MAPDAQGSHRGIKGIKGNGKAHGNYFCAAAWVLESSVQGTMQIQMEQTWKIGRKLRYIGIVFCEIYIYICIHIYIDINIYE